MSSSTTEPLTAAVLTVGDSSSRGERADLSGPAVAQLLTQKKFKVVASETVPDEQDAIKSALVRLAERARFVITTGGTGISARDVTPEASWAVSDRVMARGADRLRVE